MAGGFWLYHRRHLPAAHGERRGQPVLTAHLWTLVGLSIVPGALAGCGQPNGGEHYLA